MISCGDSEESPGVALHRRNPPPFQHIPNKGHLSATSPEERHRGSNRRRTSDGVRLLRKALPQVKLVNCEMLRVKPVRRTLQHAFTADPSCCMTQSLRTSCAPFLANYLPKLGTISPALTGKCSALLEKPRHDLTADGRNPQQPVSTALSLGRHSWPWNCGQSLRERAGPVSGFVHPSLQSPPCAQ